MKNKYCINIFYQKKDDKKPVVLQPIRVNGLSECRKKIKEFFKDENATIHYCYNVKCFIGFFKDYYIMCKKEV